MTITAHPSLSDADARKAAREDYRRDSSLSGADLGRRYGRSDKWGRNQIRAVKEESETAVRPVPAPSPRSDPKAMGGQFRTMEDPYRRKAPPADPWYRKPNEQEASPQRKDAPAVPAGPARTDRHRQVVTLSTVVAVAAALILSAGHQIELAERAEQDLPWLVPACTDGLMAAAAGSFSIRRTWLAGISLTLAVVASITANVLAVVPDLVDETLLKGSLAAWTALSAALAAALLHNRSKETS